MIMLDLNGLGNFPIKLKIDHKSTTIPWSKKYALS